MSEKSLLASVLVAVSQAIAKNPLQNAEAIQDIDIELRRVLSGVLESPMLVISDCRSACAEIHDLLAENPFEICGDISNLTDATEIEEEPKKLELVQQLHDFADSVKKFAYEQYENKLYAQVDDACIKVYCKTKISSILIDAQVSKEAKRFDRLTEDQQAFVYAQIDNIQYAIAQLLDYANDNNVDVKPKLFEFFQELTEIYCEFQNQVDDCDYDHSEGKSLAHLRELLSNLDENSFSTDR